MSSFVNLLIEGYQLCEHWHSILDGKIVSGLRVAEGTPHDSPERGTSIKESSCLLSKDTGKEARVVHWVESHPVLLSCDPFIEVVEHTPEHCNVAPYLLFDVRSEV